MDQGTLLLTRRLVSDLRGSPPGSSMLRSLKRRNVRPGRVVLWALAASFALLVLGGVVLSQLNRRAQRGATFLSESPSTGVRVFQTKGCIDCHAVNGVGATAAPDLGRKRSEQPDLPQLVAAMWNHAPRMWQRMNEKRVQKPSLDDQEVAAIFAYLYMAQHVEGLGDSKRGYQIFGVKGCAQCHTLGEESAKRGLTLATSSEARTPAHWMEALWNHAPQMQIELEKTGLSWPEFEGHDFSDLYSYVKEKEQTASPPVDDVPPDPARGWKLFQEKRCIACHSIKNDDGRAGPTLGANRNLPATFTQLGQLMVSKAPKMLRMMSEEGMAPPHLRGQDMMDLFAFLYSLRYVEPTGSAHVGRSLFSWRGCYRCHGADGEGTAHGPALRGRGRQYTAIGLAAALWRHGPDMNRRSMQMNIGWPTLLETDVGDLLAFLGSPVEQTEASQ